MKIEKKMYIRTKEGIICKVLKLNEPYEDDGYLDHNDIGSVSIREESVRKADYNIIELLEPFDLMYIDISPDDFGGIVVPRIAETINELKKWKDKFKSGECILRGVVCREELERKMYIIGGN